MLYVRLNRPLSSGNARDERVEIPLPAPLDLRAGEKCAVFSTGAVSLVRIVAADRAAVSAQRLEDFPAGPAVERALFRRKPFFFHPEKFYDRIRALCAALARAPEFVHWKEKTGKYLRCVAAGGESPSFREGYLDWDAWEKARAELERLRRETNEAVRTGNREERDRTRAARSLILSHVLEEMGLGDLTAVSPGAVRLLTVFLEPDTAVPPFDEISGDLVVTFRITGEKPDLGRSRTDQTESRWTLLYSEARPSSRPEAAVLAGDLRTEGDVDLFGDDRFGEYRSRLAGTQALHFSGHGVLSGNSGFVHIGGEPLSDLSPYGRGIRFSFLNCCETGAVSGGIVGDLAGGNGGYVVASPYEIPDEMTENVREFYRFLDIRDPETAFRIMAVKDGSFPGSYRFFGPNATKFD